MVHADLSTNLVLFSSCSVSACSHFAVRLATVLAARLDVEEWIFVTLDPATTKHQDFLSLWAGEEQNCRSWVKQEMMGRL